MQLPGRPVLYLLGGPMPVRVDGVTTNTYPEPPIEVDAALREFLKSGEVTIELQATPRPSPQVMARLAAPDPIVLPAPPPPEPRDEKFSDEFDRRIREARMKRRAKR